MVGGALSAHAAGGDRELQIKAAYLLNFAKLVTWPETVEEPSRFQIAVLGDPYLWQECRSELVGKRVDGKRISVTAFSFEDALEAAPATRILYVGDCEPERLDELIAALGDRPILLVGDRPGFCDRGGSIGLLKQEDGFQFEINRRLELRSGMTINSRLLRLAQRVIQ